VSKSLPTTAAPKIATTIKKRIIWGCPNGGTLESTTNPPRCRTGSGWIAKPMIHCPEDYAPVLLTDDDYSGDPAEADPLVPGWVCQMPVDFEHVCPTDAPVGADGRCWTKRTKAIEVKCVPKSDEELYMVSAGVCYFKKPAPKKLVCDDGGTLVDDMCEVKDQDDGPAGIVRKEPPREECQGRLLGNDGYCGVLLARYGNQTCPVSVKSPDRKETFTVTKSCPSDKKKLCKCTYPATAMKVYKCPEGSTQINDNCIAQVDPEWKCSEGMVETEVDPVTKKCKTTFSFMPATKLN